MLDIILIVLAIICMLVGLIGSIIPGLPGPPLSYIGLILIHFTHNINFTASQLVWWLILTLLTIVFDYFLPVLGVKKWNGSKWGNWGCIIGTFIGCFVYPPWGIIVGPFVGAVLGEKIIAKRSGNEAIYAGFGAFMGFMLGVIFKVIVCAWFIYCGIVAFF